MSKRRKRGSKSPTTIRLSENAQAIVAEMESRHGYTASRVINLMIEIARDAIHDPKARLPLWRKYLEELERRQTLAAKAGEKVADAEKSVRAAAKALHGTGARTVAATQLDEMGRASERGTPS